MDVCDGCYAIGRRQREAIDMKSLFALFWVALSLSQILVPLTRWLFVRFGKLDLPGERKTHTVAVPRSGGVAVILSYLFAIGIVTMLPAGGNYVIEQRSDFLLRFLPAVGVVFLTGFLDDMFDLRPIHKLAGQLLAASMAYWAGIRMFEMSPGMEWISISCTILWLILCSNAFNLTDGTDGLAGTLGVVSCLGLITVALTLDYYSLAYVFAPLLGAILPFLRANWPPALLFLGDTGSLTMGFLIGCGGAVLSKHFPSGDGLISAVLILTLPLMETMLSSTRRLLRGRPVFSADSNHIHHRLKRQGHGSAGVLWRLGMLALLGTAIAVLQIGRGVWERIFLVGPFLLFLGHSVARLRYPEFLVLGEAFLGGRIRSWLRHQILLRSLEDDLKAANSVREAIGLLAQGAVDLGLLELNVMLAGVSFSEAAPTNDPPNTYAVRVDLPMGSWVNYRVPVHLKRMENPAADYGAVVLRILSAQRLERLQQAEVRSGQQHEAILA